MNELVAAFRRPLIRVLLFIILAAALLFQWSTQRLPASISGYAETRDGDSINIGRHRIRLEGIDAPERRQLCKRHGETWACGRAAQRHLARLIGDQSVTCVVSKQDKFARYLARCLVGTIDVNRGMVRDGMAVAFGRMYFQDEADARSARVGLWAGQFERPQEWRRSNPRR